ncbi:MAG: hypothetical protein K8S21_10245 [Gemmatimonadetes bacterium]|nr:hypothetical protein [Gemmatimonadota bacterium]
MSCVRVVVLSLVVGTALGAQSAPSVPRRAPLPLKQSLSFDLTAALDDRWRLAVEPLVIGRFTLGLSAAHTTEVDRPSQPVIYETFATRPMDLSFAPCLPLYGPCGPFPDGEPSYRASSLALHARWYPAVLSRDGDRQAFAVYIGEFLSYEKRRVSWPQWIYPPYYPPTDSLIIVIPGPPSPGPTVVQHLRGWEPGAEIGARVMMGRHVLIDVGGTVRVATLDDPLSRQRPGRTDARFVVAIGIGW